MRTSDAAILATAIARPSRISAVVGASAWNRCRTQATKPRRRLQRSLAATSPTGPCPGFGRSRGALGCRSPGSCRTREHAIFVAAQRPAAFRCCTTTPASCARWRASMRRSTMPRRASFSRRERAVCRPCVSSRGAPKVSPRAIRHERTVRGPKQLSGRPQRTETDDNPDGNTRSA